jgi:hypothetical protein
MSYSKDAKPNAATYRRRALVLIEACESGLAIAEAAGHKKLATKFKNTLAWANDIRRSVDAGVR